MRDWMLRYLYYILKGFKETHEAICFTKQLLIDTSLNKYEEQLKEQINGLRKLVKLSIPFSANRNTIKPASRMGRV